MARLNVNDARCEALFASTLQRSDAPTPQAVAEAIRAAVREFGTRGCAELMAQEFGDHPETATERMRWARQLAGDPLPRISPATAHPPVRRAAAVAHRRGA
jgi:hypothetical protein